MGAMELAADTPSDRHPHRPAPGETRPVQRLARQSRPALPCSRLPSPFLVQNVHPASPPVPSRRSSRYGLVGGQRRTAPGRQWTTVPRPPEEVGGSPPALASSPASAAHGARANARNPKQWLLWFGVVAMSQSARRGAVPMPIGDVCRTSDSNVARASALQKEGPLPR